jgi:uncharacterized phage-associated protein
MVTPVFYTKNQINKIGNTLIYLATHIPNLTKTKLLKLLFFLEIAAIKRSGFGFLNLSFDVWKLGPVAKDIFVELSSDEPTLLSNYISIERDNRAAIISPKTPFNDDEFSDNDLILLDLIIEKYGNLTANELVKLSHNKHLVWYKTAQRAGLIDLFEQNRLSVSDIEIDLSETLEDDPEKRAFYLENKRFFEFSQSLKV